MSVKKMNKSLAVSNFNSYQSTKKTDKSLAVNDYSYRAHELIQHMWV